MPSKNQEPAVRWWWLVLTAAVVIAAYAPALDGPYVLDDVYQGYAKHQSTERVWKTHRPITSATFWLNAVTTGYEPFAYHATSIALHLAAVFWAWLVLRRLHEIAGGRADSWIPWAGAAFFAVHPVHTESVAYVVSRSELLCALFSFAALRIYLDGLKVMEPSNPRQAISAVLLMGGAVLSKEQAVALPAVFLLIDYYWRGNRSLRGIAVNWKLHAAIAVAGAMSVATVWKTIASADTVGFRVAGLSAPEYFLTQCRVLWRYMGLIVFPAGLNADPDIAITRTFADPYSLAGLARLCGLMVAAAVWRNRFPTASFGVFVFFVLIAPTSSVVPILDPLAERRLYYPFVGVALVLMELLSRWQYRWHPARAAMTAVLAVFSYMTWARATVWGDELLLWRATVAESPAKQRPRFQLAFTLYSHGQCGEAVAEFEKAAKLGERDVRLLVDWALALDCAGRMAEAEPLLAQAARMENTAIVHSTLGMVFAKQGKSAQALAALEAAERADPQFAATYVYRGNVYAASGDWAGAAREYQRAIAVDPNNAAAHQSLANARLRLGGGR